jgi:hypothetical protein
MAAPNGLPVPVRLVCERSRKDDSAEADVADLVVSHPEENVVTTPASLHGRVVDVPGEGQRPDLVTPRLDRAEYAATVTILTPSALNLITLVKHDVGTARDVGDFRPQKPPPRRVDSDRHTQAPERGATVVRHIAMRYA